MNGISKITERIERDMAAEIAVIEQQAQQEAAEITGRYQAQADQERAAIEERGHAAAAERQKRLVGVAELDAKKLELATKQQAIHQAFCLAAARLNSLPEAEYVELLATLAARAAQSGREQIILSPQDREQLGGKVVQAANSRLQNGALTLADTARPIEGGLLLAEGDIEINCTFASLIRLLQDEMAADVAKCLFD